MSVRSENAQVCGHPFASSDTEKDGQELDVIIRNRRLSVLLQPIADFSSQGIKGYEALIRGPSDSPLHGPLMLLGAAHRQGRIAELDLLCREIAVQEFKRLDLPGKLFLNIIPSTLLHPEHRSGQTLEVLERLGLSPDCVVMELTEHFPLDDYAVMRQATQHYKAMGFEIAIDDLGSGYAGLRMWSELEPNYVKIDKHFIQGICEDAVKREFVRSIGEMSNGLNCQVVAEGIETQAECEVVCELGIHLGQGYYFARPHALPPKELDQSLFLCSAMGSSGSVRFYLSDTVASIVNHSPSVTPEVTVEEAGNLFRSKVKLMSLPVVDAENRPIGVLRRQRLMDVMSTQFGLALHGKKSVRVAMDEHPIVVDEGMRVEQVSQYLTDHVRPAIDQDFIVTRSGSYIGLATMLDLLKRITELQIRNARYANPLTQLPGNVPIYETVDRMLQDGMPFWVAYYDLDEFKPFNDTYGYAKGDYVLKRLAKLLASLLGEGDFLGHVGGDDFIVVFRSADWEQRCREALAAFARLSPGFYNEADRVKGGHETAGRNGCSRFHPFISLSIGVVKLDRQRCYSHHEVAVLASAAKHQAKQLKGNNLYIHGHEGESPSI